MSVVHECRAFILGGLHISGHVIQGAYVKCRIHMSRDSSVSDARLIHMSRNSCKCHATHCKTHCNAASHTATHPYVTPANESPDV